MINVAIVEDEISCADQLESYLKRYKEEKEVDFHITRFTDGDGITEGYSGDFDIILMDIQMRFMDGMSAAEEIRRLDPDVTIIFVTNMTEYAIKGYEVDALDYVVKPVEYHSFSRKLDRAVAKLKKRAKVIPIPTERGVRKLELEQILYIEIRDHTLFYHMKDEEIRARGRSVMKELEKDLEPFGFFRCNSCYIVNMMHVEKIKDYVCMVGKEEIQVSRARKKPFMDALVKYIADME